MGIYNQDNNCECTDYESTTQSERVDALDRLTELVADGVGEMCVLEDLCEYQTEAQKESFTIAVHFAYNRFLKIYMLMADFYETYGGPNARLD